MDLDERSLRLTDGPPCEHAYETFVALRATQSRPRHDRYQRP